MNNPDPKPVQFVCENCGFDCGLVQTGFSEKCPLCGSSLSYDGILYGCFLPEATLWVPAAAWILLIGGISNSLLQTPLATYGFFPFYLAFHFLFGTRKIKTPRIMQLA